MNDQCRTLTTSPYARHHNCSTETSPTCSDTSRLSTVLTAYPLMNLRHASAWALSSELSSDLEELSRDREDDEDEEDLEL